MHDNNDSSSAAPVKTHPVVLISGISGSGKSVALNALEDAGYFLSLIHI